MTSSRNSKKWPKHKKLDDNGEVVKNAKGKTVLVNAYSLLQDHFFEHMREAGFLGFERGERGSTAEHLAVLEYKAKMEAERAAAEAERAAAMTAIAEEKQKEAAALSVVVAKKQEAAAVLDKKTEKAQKQLDGLEAKTAVAEKAVAELETIEKLGHSRTITGAVSSIPAKMWDKIISLIREAFKSRDIIKALRRKVNESAPTIAALEKELAQEKKARAADKASFSDIMEYNTAKARAPQRLAAVIAEIKRSPSEYDQQRQNHNTIKKKTHEIGG